MWAAGGLFLLVLAASVLLIAYFDRRDARIRAALDEYLGARFKLLTAAKGYRSGPTQDSAVAITELVMLGHSSLEAFGKARVLLSDLEPDDDWTDTLRWVEQETRSLRHSGGQ